MMPQSANVNTLSDYISMMSTELLFLTFFGLGFFLLHSVPEQFRKLQKMRKVEDADVDVWKTIDVESRAGHFQGVLDTWRSAITKDLVTPVEMFRLVVEAFLEVDKTNMVRELTAHVKAHKKACCHQKVAANILEVLARAGEIDEMEEILKLFTSELKLSIDTRIYDVLIGGYASVGREEKVQEVVEHLQAAGHRATARGYSLSIKGFLKNSMPEAALKQILAMKDAGFYVPPFAVAQIFRMASEAKLMEEFFTALEHSVPLSAEAASMLFEEFCGKQTQIHLATRIEAWARRSDVPTSSGAYEWLLKHWTGIGDSRAFDLFEEMCTTGARMSDALVVTLLVKCSEMKLVAFAESIVQYIRDKQKMTIAMYSALMKVYAMSNLASKACDLYDAIIAEGLEPDGMMYGCLMKFSADCGRSSLAQKLFDKAPRLEIQNYMSLIRAAGRDGDVERAFDVLKKLQDSGMPMDLAAYNCVLDVCVSSGNTTRARELICDMKKASRLDVVTWNTLMKGFCSKGDLEGAMTVLHEMEVDGHSPDDITFNCLINAAVSTGDLSEAWSIVGMMEHRGIKADRYTLSILMKSMRKSKASPQDVGRALALLDKSSLDVFTDEVLLNTVVEVCMRNKESRRLQAIIDSLPSTGLKPSVHTYGTLIKACSSLRRTRQCRQLWDEMVRVRHMEPDKIALGCMLDALVCNGKVDEAVSLLEDWQDRIPPNPVLYSTIIKGFAHAKQPDKALATWEKMRASAGKLTEKTYNLVIDAQARVGAMDAVSKLIEAMREDECIPDESTSLTIMKGYCVKGDMDRAMDVFKHLSDQGLVKDGCMYNALLDGCVRHGRCDLAASLLEDMQQRKITPSKFMLGILVKLFTRRGKTDQALKIAKTWPGKYNLTATGQAWTNILHGYIHENNLETACAIFEHMKRTGLRPDAKAYGALMSACVRKGNLLKALAILDEAHGLGAVTSRGLPPDQWLEAEQLEALVRAVVHRQGSAAAAALLHRLVDAGAPINAYTFGLSSSGV